MEDMLTTYINKVKKGLKEKDALAIKRYNEQKNKIYKWLKGLLPYRFEIEECSPKEQAESRESYSNGELTYFNKSVETNPVRSYNFCRIKDLRTGESIVVKVLENFNDHNMCAYPQRLYFSTCLYIGLTGDNHHDSFIFGNYYIKLETIEHLTISLRVLMRRLEYCISPLSELEMFFRGGTEKTEFYLAVAKWFSKYVASNLLKIELLDAIEKQNIKKI
jgi:hypothetical protein